MNTPWNLFDAYLDDALTPDENHELQRWLAADRQHIRQFVFAVHQHRALRSQALGRRAETFGEIALDGAEEATRANETTGRLAHPGGAMLLANASGASSSNQAAPEPRKPFRQI